MKKITWGLATVGAILLLLPLTAYAQSPPPDATLYELTENMKLSGGKMLRRLAVSALGGFANAGPPLCPFLTSGQCEVHATGTDNVNTSTGKGPVNGDFVVVVQGDNPFDGPEFVVMRGNFRGSIDLSSALLGGPPLGTMTGSLVVQGGGGKHPFVGVFRLPVDCGLLSNPQFLSGVICYVTSGPDGVPTGAIPADPIGYALGSPTVRLDIYFQ